MRGKNRKSIASCIKFPQFTTMNVIDGQAGLVFYSSLFFYSLTINNILNIIVLLILAGVTIAMLGGNNGTPAKANEAAAKDAVAAAKDRINLVASDALLDFYNLTYVNDTSIGSTDVKEQAQTAVWNKVKAESNYEGVTLTPNDTKKTITVKSTKDTSVSATCTVKQGGGITWGDYKVAGEEGVKIKVNGETKTVTEANAKDFYGTTVASVTVGSKTTSYGLYYIDYAGAFGEEGTVYLKALTSAGNIIPYANLIKDSDQKIEAVRIMKLLNPDWAENRGDIAYDSMQSNEKGAAILCNPSNSLWSGVQTAFENKYGKENVNYVVGAPSSEMLTKAINEAGGLSGTGALDSRWFAAKDNNNTTTTSPNTYSGYLFSIRGRNTNNNTGYGFKSQSDAQKNALTSAQKAMYYSNCTQWLASPASYKMDDRRVCCVYSDGGLSHYDYYNGLEACPLVSLKSGVDLTTN